LPSATKFKKTLGYKMMDEQRQAIVDAYRLVPQTSDELMKDDYAIEVLRQKIPVELRPGVEETRRLLLVIRKGGHLPRLREKLVQAVDDTTRA